MLKPLILSFSLLGLIAGLPAQSGQTANEAWVTDGSVNFEGLGRRLYIPDDLDGDGVKDLIGLD